MSLHIGNQKTSVNSNSNVYCCTQHLNADVSYSCIALSELLIGLTPLELWFAEKLEYLVR